MPIDTSIPLSVNSLVLPNPLEAAARAETIRAAQSQNKLTDYRLKSAQRKQEVQNALNDAYKDSFDPETGEINLNKLRVGLASRGIGSEIPGVEKTMAELNKEKWAGEKEFNSALSKEMENSKVRLESIDPDSPDAPVQMLRWHRENNRMPALSRYLKTAGVDPARSEQELIATLSQPGGAKKAYQRSALGLSKVMENHFTTMNLGDEQVLMTTPKYGEGDPNVISRQQVGMTPYQQESLDIQRNRVDAKTDPSAAAFQSTDAAGNVTFYNRQGQPMSVQKGAGKPSATYEKTKADAVKMARDTDDLIAELKTLTSRGEDGQQPSMIEQSTGSGAGSFRDSAFGFFGKATLGAIMVGRLKPIADKALKMVPRFEGPQSDKDTESYKAAAGDLANDKLPVDIRQAAALEILRITEKRKGQFAIAGQEPPVPTGIAPPNVPAPAGNLPSPNLDSPVEQATPAGIDESLWKYMTPEERALWQ